MRNKSAKHIHFFDFGIFYGTLMFSVGFTFEEIQNHLIRKKVDKEWLLAFNATKKNFVSHVAGHASRQIIYEGENEKSGRTYFFVHLKDAFDFKNDKHHKILSHELIHIVTYNLMDALDIVKENEAFAYTHSYLLDKIYKLLRS